MGAATRFRCAVTFLLAAATLPSQGDVPRLYGSQSTTYQDGAEHGWLNLHRNSSGQVELVWDLFIAGNHEITRAMPFDVAGGLTEIGPRHFVATGATYAGTVPTGYVVEVVLQQLPRTISIASSTQHPGLDVVELDFNPFENLLYGIDHVTEHLVFTPWTGSAPATGSFATATTPTQLFILPDSRLRRVASGMGIELVSRFEPDSTTSPYKARVEYVGTGWMITPAYRTAPPSQWGFVDWQANAHGPTVEVVGHEGAFGAVHIEDVNGLAIASGTTNAAGEASIPAPRGTLVPGSSYRVAGGNHVASTWQTFNSEWGIGTQDELELRRSDARALYSGNPAFSVSTRGFWSGTSPPLQDPETYLVIGFNIGPVDQITIDPAAGTASIDNISGIVGPIPMPISALGELDQGSALVELTIPHGLEGLEVVFQWLSWDGAKWAMTEVFGSRIFPAATSAAAANAGPGAPDSQDNHAKKLKKAKKWLRSRELTKPTPSKLAAVHQAHASQGN